MERNKNPYCTLEYRMACVLCPKQNSCKSMGDESYFDHHQPTRYNKAIAEMTIEKLAELMIESDWIYDECGVQTIYRTSFCKDQYYVDFDCAVSDQIEYLQGVDE